LSPGELGDLGREEIHVKDGDPERPRRGEFK